MTTETISAPDLLDVGEFAARVLGRPAWPHQVEVLRDPARYRCLVAGRQSGKSSTLAIAALHTGATRRNALVLIVSAGEVAARRLLADVAAIATSSPMFAGSVLDESKGALVLSNGSRIVSVPASSRQVRGWSIDLLILDEAAFIDSELWRSAEPAIAARPGSRVLAASSPWGPVDHWFRRLWQQGTDAPDGALRSWHWPSSVSPLMDRTLLAQIRERESDDYYRREFLAEFTDSAGSYFSEQEIMSAVADYEMTPPEDLGVRKAGQRSAPVAAGVDWGLRQDANALCLIGRMADSPDGRARLFVPWTEARHNWPFTEFIGRVADVAERYWVRVVAAERNGIGEFPTSELDRELHGRRTRSRVAPIWTDQRFKMSGFGRLKGWMQTGRLVLPLHAPMLRELRGLSFEQSPSGGLRIAVPEALGHDDIVMSLLLAASCVEPAGLVDEPELSTGVDEAAHVRTGAGVLVPRRPRVDPDHRVHLTVPAGEEPGDGW